MTPQECRHILLSTHASSTAHVSGTETRHKCLGLNAGTCGAGRLAKTLAAALLLICFASSAPAQVDRSALTGTVTDPVGRVLPQARVTAVQSESGLRRETTTSSTGTYDIPELPVGVYTITFEHDGFKLLTFVDVEQVVGRTRTLNATLQVSGGEQRIKVSPSSEQLDKTSDALSTRIEQVQVKELPLNGRNWATLTALEPGAVDTGGSNQFSVRFAGRGRDDDNFTYDGVDATNIVNQAQRPYVRLAIPLDTIEEFRVDSMLATAESGATGGPQLAVTSPSGTNQWHGRAFEYLRNNVFDALVPALVPGPVPPQQPLHLNQFGASVGGPIVRDRTFIFLAYEGYRQYWGFPLNGTVPSASLRAQVMAQSPVLAPIISAYPVGQTPKTTDVDNFVGEGRQQVFENSAMIRLDQRFSPNTTAFLRFNFDRAVNRQPLGVLEDQAENTANPVNGAIELLHTFSPTLINEFKVGYNRGTTNTFDRNQSGIPYAVSVSGGTDVDGNPVSGLSGLNNNRVSIGVGNSFSEIDNATWIRGRHTLKAGAEVRRIQLNQGNTEAGTITFNAIAPYTSGTQAFAANLITTATLNGTLPINGLRKTQYFGYIQDEFKWKPNFTINLGLRYSFFNIFHEVEDRANPFDFATCGAQGFCGVGASFGQNNYGDLDPRIAFAWAPRALNDHTVFRIGYGIYHEDGQLDDQNLPISNEVFAYKLQASKIPGLSYPIDPYLATATGIVSPRDDDRRRKDTYVEQWGLSVQQVLPANFVSTFSYVGSKGVHLLTLSEVNVKDLQTGLQPYPAFGVVSWRGNRDDSNYNGLSVSVKRSFTHGFLLGANYMWSHEIDDGSNGSGDGDSLVAQNVACQACERADGIWDVRHVFNANAVYQLPFGPGKPYLNEPGIPRAIFGSWELTSMIVARTGFPVNVTIDRTAPDLNSADQRPDIIPGVPLTPPGGRSPAEWFNTAAFSTTVAGAFGDTPRDFLRGPGAWQLDLGIGKRLPITERVAVDFRSEFFNIFNHPQYGLPNSDVTGSNFGRITQTVNTTTPVSPVGTGTPREIQLALRVSF